MVLQIPSIFFLFVEDRRSHLTGIMIGATCGIIFIVLCFLAVVHTRKHRFQRAHSRRSELTSTASFDVHEANAPPSYATGMLLSWFQDILLYWTPCGVKTASCLKFRLRGHATRVECRKLAPFASRVLPLARACVLSARFFLT